MENPGIDPGTSHMQSERSTTWANSPLYLRETAEQESVMKRRNFTCVKDWKSRTSTSLNM